MSINKTLEKFVTLRGECWEWEGAKDTKGYGHLGRQGKTLGSHRYIFEQLIGEIGGLTLDHICKNVACVYPHHLEPVTMAENIKRGGNSQKTHCPSGHEYNEENTYIYQNKRRKTRQRMCKKCWESKK